MGFEEGPICETFGDKHILRKLFVNIVHVWGTQPRIYVRQQAQLGRRELERLECWINYDGRGDDQEGLLEDGAWNVQGLNSSKQKVVIKDSLLS